LTVNSDLYLVIRGQNNTCVKSIQLNVQNVQTTYDI